MTDLIVIHKLWFLFFYGQFYFLDKCIMYAVGCTGIQNPFEQTISWNAGNRVHVWSTLLYGLSTDFKDEIFNRK